MLTFTAWRVDQAKILTRRELAAVLADLKRKAPRSPSTRLNLVVFRLACCCGLRASEIAGLRLDDVIVAGDRPHLRIRRHVAKGGRRRTVPLWWDKGTFSDLAAWRAERAAQGGSALFVASRQSAAREKPLSRHTLRKRFLTACKVLGPERRRTLTIHHGRHTFISHALAGARSLAEVREAAGHASLLATSAYLHVAVEDGDGPGTLFRFA
jgi:integrase